MLDEPRRPPETDWWDRSVLMGDRAELRWLCPTERSVSGGERALFRTPWSRRKTARGRLRAGTKEWELESELETLCAARFGLSSGVSVVRGKRELSGTLTMRRSLLMLLLAQVAPPQGAPDDDDAHAAVLLCIEGEDPPGGEAIDDSGGADAADAAAPCSHALLSIPGAGLPAAPEGVRLTFMVRRSVVVAGGAAACVWGVVVGEGEARERDEGEASGLA